VHSCVCVLTLLKPPGKELGGPGANCGFLTLGFPFDSRHNSKFKRGRTELLQGTRGLLRNTRFKKKGIYFLSKMYEIGMKIRADMKKRRGGEPYMVTLT
jgi:hypothetical protein